MYVKNIQKREGKTSRTQAQRVNVLTPPRATVRFSQNTPKRDCRPNSTRNNPENFPDRLVGPSPIVSVQVEGIYTRALLDTGAQVTLLYGDFYDKYLSHIPL